MMMKDKRESEINRWSLKTYSLLTTKEPTLNSRKRGLSKDKEKNLGLISH